MTIVFWVWLVGAIGIFMLSCFVVPPQSIYELVVYVLVSIAWPLVLIGLLWERWE